jgi:hypothetical protein
VQEEMKIERRKRRRNEEEKSPARAKPVKKSQSKTMG